MGGWVTEHSHLAYFCGGGRRRFPWRKEHRSCGACLTLVTMPPLMFLYFSCHVLRRMWEGWAGGWAGLTCGLSGALGLTSGKRTTQLAPPAQNPQSWPFVRNLPVGDWLGVAKSREKFQRNNSTEVIQYPFLRNQSWAKWKNQQDPIGMLWKRSSF